MGETHLDCSGKELPFISWENAMRYSVGRAQFASVFNTAVGLFREEEENRWS